MNDIKQINDKICAVIENYNVTLEDYKDLSIMAHFTCKKYEKGDCYKFDFPYECEKNNAEVRDLLSIFCADKFIN